MPATLKVVEILAPRTSLAAPEDPGAGNELLEAISSLIARGLDPELALEASLRASVDQGADAVGVSPIAGIESERGRESA
jgi:hypothetical protein